MMPCVQKWNQGEIFAAASGMAGRFFDKPMAVKVFSAKVVTNEYAS